MPGLRCRRPGGCEDGNEPFEYGTGKDLRLSPASDFVEDDIFKITGRNYLISGYIAIRINR